MYAEDLVMEWDEWEAARRGAEGIISYAAAGRKFTDRQNRDGRTSAMDVARQGPAAIAAFAAAGGKFTDQQDKDGSTAAMEVAHNAESIAAFAAAGGTFTNQTTRNGVNAGMLAARAGPEAIAAFLAAGGTFTDQEDTDGWNARRYAEIYTSYDYPAVDAYDAAIQSPSYVPPLLDLNNAIARLMQIVRADFSAAGPATEKVNRVIEAIGNMSSVSRKPASAPT